MCVLFYRVADVEGLLALDVARLRTLSKGNAVHHAVAEVVYQLQLDVLLIVPYHLAGAVVVYLACTEGRLEVIGAKGFEALNLVDGSCV